MSELPLATGLINFPNPFEVFYGLVNWNNLGAQVGLGLSEMNCSHKIFVGWQDVDIYGFPRNVHTNIFQDVLLAGLSRKAVVSSRFLLRWYTCTFMISYNNNRGKVFYWALLSWSKLSWIFSVFWVHLVTVILGSTVEMTECAEKGRAYGCLSPLRYANVAMKSVWHGS